MQESATHERPCLAPTRSTRVIRRLGTPIWLRMGLNGTIEIPGRSSGAKRIVILVPFKVDGVWYVIGFHGQAQ